MVQQPGLGQPYRDFPHTRMALKNKNYRITHYGLNRGQQGPCKGIKTVSTATCRDQRTGANTVMDMPNDTEDQM